MNLSYIQEAHMCSLVTPNAHLLFFSVDQKLHQWFCTKKGKQSSSIASFTAVRVPSSSAYNLCPGRSDNRQTDSEVTTEFNTTHGEMYFPLLTWHRILFFYKCHSETNYKAKSSLLVIPAALKYFLDQHVLHKLFSGPL